MCDEHVIIECRRVHGHIWQRYGRWMRERAASKQGEAVAALREGSKVRPSLRPERRRSTAGSEHTSLERPDNAGRHRMDTAADNCCLRVGEEVGGLVRCNAVSQSQSIFLVIVSCRSVSANIYNNNVTIAASLPRVRPGSPRINAGRRDSHPRLRCAPRKVPHDNNVVTASLCPSILSSTSTTTTATSLLHVYRYPPHALQGSS